MYGTQPMNACYGRILPRSSGSALCNFTARGWVTASQVCSHHNSARRFIMLVRESRTMVRREMSSRFDIISNARIWENRILLARVKVDTRPNKDIGLNDI